MFNLHDADIHISDHGLLDEKLSRFGPDTMRIVTDFDATLSIYGGPTSWSFLRDIWALPQAYHDEAAALFRHYHPYESDTSLDAITHNHLMQEWWRKHLALFRTYGLRREHFNMIDASKMNLRTGIKEALHAFNKYDIPTLILSAWVSQSIELVLEAHNLISNNISVTANRPLFDNDGSYIGIDPPGHIHAGNKDEQHASREAQKTYDGRPNILLLWDNLWDIRMIQTHERDQTIAIGFCTTTSRKVLEGYKRTFDIVVTSDVSDHGVMAAITKRLGLEL